MMDSAALTREVKDLTRELGSDLVGVAPVERWSKAPIEHSPEGIFPEARAVIVCGIHFLDATTELSQEKDVRVPGPALTEMNASGHLKCLSFRLARELQDRGWRAICVGQSGLWNYRPHKGAPRGWMADMCHYYAAVAAGLGEIGWHNICITPEYGTRQRFVSIITDAPLEPDPMYSGEPLCDKCLLCAKYCPAKSFDKEVSGMCEVEIGGRTFRFPNRNLWRCAIQENFQLDILLDLPDRVDEQTIIDLEEKAVKEHPEWIYGWKMGECLKYCLPPKRRYFDPQYCKSPRRKRDVAADTSKEACTRLMAELFSLADKLDTDIVGAASIEEFESAGMDLKQYLPDAESVVVIGLGWPEHCRLNTGFLASRAELWLARHIQKYGFSAMTHSALSSEAAALVCGVAKKDADGKVTTPRFGERQLWRAIITSMPLTKTVRKEKTVEALPKSESPASLTEKIKKVASDAGADLIGIAPSERMDGAADALRVITEAEENYFVVEDQGWSVGGDNVWGNQGMPLNPRAEEVKLSPKKPADYLPEGRSVIVVGLHLLEASIDRAGKPPAGKAGHYQESTHVESHNQIRWILLKMAKFLDAHGYKAFPTFDLCGLASRVYGGNFDLTACRFAAVATGLGEIGWNGLVLTPQFGARQRFAALITDAPLEYNGVYDGPSLCRRCFKCVDSCAVGAISRIHKHSVTIGGGTFEWGKVDRIRCDCAKRYALVADAGPKYVGSQSNFVLPEKISPDFVCEAMTESDRFQRTYYCTIVERCFTDCPAHRKSLAAQK